MGLQAHRQRGGYIGADSATRANFARASNRVKEFLDEMTRPVVRPEGTRVQSFGPAGKAGYDNGYQAGGRNGFMDKVRGCGVDEFTHAVVSALSP